MLRLPRSDPNSNPLRRAVRCSPPQAFRSPRSIATVRRVKESKEEVTLEATLRDGRTVQTRWRREAGKWVADLSLSRSGG